MKEISAGKTSHGLLTALLYGAFVVVIGFAAARAGLSHYHMESALQTDSEAEAAEAIRYEPGNVEAYRARGTISLRKKEYAAAAEAFEQGIALNENDFMLWLRLGYSRRQLDDRTGAESAYQRAVILAPNYSQPNYYLGKLLLDHGQTEEAFSFLRKAAENDRDLYPEVQHLARMAYPADPSAIENALQPDSLSDKRSLARYLIKHHYMTGSMRSFLLSDELGKSEKDEFVKYLLHKQEFQLAREVWESRFTEKDGLGEPLYDGGFERITENDQSGLGWQIDQKISATAVARDSQNFHTGSTAILIKFAGNVETNRPILSQLVFIEPHRKYQLRFFYRSSEMISAGLPEVTVADGVTNDVIGRSPALQASGGAWVESVVDFTAGDAPTALVSIQRPNCNTSPCPIFGDLTVDDLSLIRK